MNARVLSGLRLLVAGLALSPSTAAWAGDIPFEDLIGNASINLSPVPATQGSPTAPPAPHIAQLDLAAVPKESIPPPLDQASAPTRIPAEATSTSLRLTDITRPKLARFKAGQEPLEVHIESVEPGVGGGYFTRATMPSSSPKLATTCTKGSTVQGLRWEHAHISEKGELTIDIDDGWFDPSNCSLSIERRTTLRPMMLHADGGLPLAFAMRSDRGLTFFFAPESNIAADASGELIQANGALRRVTMPLERGGASSILVSASAAKLADWKLRAMGREVPASAVAGDIAITLGIDAVQTVGDREPSVMVRSFEQTLDPGATLRGSRQGSRKFSPRR